MRGASHHAFYHIKQYEKANYTRPAAHYLQR